MSHSKLQTSNSKPPAPKRRGFTLIELLITISLVLLLMLAATQIFSLAGKTIGGGQAIGAALRDAQAAQSVLSQDFASIPADAPYFIIHSQRALAFRSRADYLASLTKYPAVFDGDADASNGDELAFMDATTANKTGNATVAAPIGSVNVISPFIYNFRNHRIDSIFMFGRGTYHRRTGNTGTLVADMTCSEAAIYIQHLQMDSANGYQSPGQNVTQYFANDWMLGRSSLLLAEQVRNPANGAKLGIYDSAGTAQAYYYDQYNGTPATQALLLTPLDTTATVSTASAGDTLETMRYDLAETSITTFRQHMYDWPLYPDKAGYAANQLWYTRIAGLNDGLRIKGKSSVAGSIDSAQVAQTASTFVPACTQFMVEFAGDFVTQDTSTGNITAAEPDGVIDYVPATHKVRWYGMPRDTNGDGLIRMADGDVVPARDVIVGAGFAAPNFEKSPAGVGLVYKADYTNFNYNASSESITDYWAAWGPGDTSRPRMIRVVIAIDRPEAEGKLSDREGPTFEQVYKVGL